MVTARNRDRSVISAWGRLGGRSGSDLSLRQEPWHAALRRTRLARRRPVRSGRCHPDPGTGGWRVRRSDRATGRGRARRRERRVHLGRPGAERLRRGDRAGPRDRRRRDRPLAGGDVAAACGRRVHSWRRTDGVRARLVAGTVRGDHAHSIRGARYLALLRQAWCVRRLEGSCRAGRWRRADVYRAFDELRARFEDLPRVRRDATGRSRSLPNRRLGRRSDAMDIRLDGRVVLLSGAAQGIGRAMAAAFHEAGCTGAPDGSRSGGPRRGRRRAPGAHPCLRPRRSGGRARAGSRRDRHRGAARYPGARRGGRAGAGWRSTGARHAERLACSVRGECRGGALACSSGRPSFQGGGLGPHRVGCLGGPGCGRASPVSRPIRRPSTRSSASCASSRWNSVRTARP